MPASIFVTHAQLAVLAETDEDVIINEQHLIGDSLDCWIMGEGSSGDHHRSMVIEQDGTVTSDCEVPDPDRVPHPGFSRGGPLDGD